MVAGLEEMVEAGSLLGKAASQKRKTRPVAKAASAGVEVAAAVVSARKR
jgi:hypothetical protein